MRRNRKLKKKKEKQKQKKKMKKKREGETEREALGSHLGSPRRAWEPKAAIVILVKFPF